MATLKDIAEIVGVKPPTVSVVLNNKETRIKVSDITRQKILDTAKELHYEANASARGLALGRSGNIGFILSDKITGGWGNDYFASQLMGVEDRCKELGYGLSISRYNLSNLEEFVFPKKVSRRNVDGLVLAGHIELEVLEKFQEFGIPCVAIGMSGISPEVSARIPTINVDGVATACAAFEYAYNLGHRRMGFCIAPKPSWRETSRKVKRRIETSKQMSGSTVQIFESNRQADFLDGNKAFESWASIKANSRPTAILGSDQAMVGFLKTLKHKGLSCPQDVSLISNADTNLCQFADPSLTAISVNTKLFGEIAVDLLVNHLDKGEDLESQRSILDPEFSLIERESCGRLYQEN